MRNPDVSQLRVSLAANPAAARLRAARVLLAGLGNIGSFLAVLLAPLVSFIRLVDRDVVESHNVMNQFYGPEHEGRAKVDATAACIKRLAPHLQVERRVADLEDLPWGDFADIDIGLAGLDSLRARQVLSEKLYPLQIPFIDGAVGDPLLVRVQVLLPGEACLQCSWGPEHYQQLSAEHPCLPGASAEAPRTMAPGCAGAAAASAMTAQCMTLFSDAPPQESLEINGDLLAGRFVLARRRRTERCRYPHETAPRVIRLERAFAEASVADLVAAVEREYGRQSVELEFRRGVLDAGLFGEERFAAPEQLHRVQRCRLVDFGLTPKDRVVVRRSQQPQGAHICFEEAERSV